MKKILIVDDVESNHFVLKDMIENRVGGVNKYVDCSVISAYSGKEALSVLFNENIDICLLDIDLPDINGYEIAEQIRKNNSLENLYIIAITGKTGKEEKESCLISGCNEYFIKPLDVMKLIDNIVGILKEKPKMNN